MPDRLKGDWEKAKVPASSRYYMPETIPFALCNACVNVALKESEKARKLYARVVESCRLPDCQEAMVTLAKKVPSGQRLVDKITDHMQIGKLGKEGESGLWLPDGGFLERMKGMMSGYLGVFKRWVDLKKDEPRSPDFRRLSEAFEEFIRESFNNASELDKGRYKVTAGGSNSLVNVISFRAMGEVRMLSLDRLENAKILRFGKGAYSLAEMNSGRGRRVQRFMAGQYKRAGYALRHDEKMAQIAWRWYQCRVVHSGPKEFCDWLRRTEKEYLEPDNVSHEIKECDEAMGYPRGSPGNASA